MSSKPLPQAADVEHFTDELRRSGVLGRRCVRDVQVESLAPRFASRVMLRLAYEDASYAPSTLSSRLAFRSDAMTSGKRVAERSSSTFGSRFDTNSPRSVLLRCRF
jgi:hypothetical protein